MNKIIMLGTGNGGPLNLYNTCFIIKNNKGNFLVDTGGSIEIIDRLNKVGIDIKELTDIFISHQHADHILGLFWLFKKLGRVAINGKIKDKINIYCNDCVYKAITEVSKYIVQEKLMNAMYSVTNFNVLNDGDHYNINGIDYEFFDIHAKGDKQYGFECMINNKKLVFLGDEDMNPALSDRVKNADYVMHEAFCLDSEENIFHAYEKNHSTVKSACEVMNKLDVKNLILYHTEDSHGKAKKTLYENEGKDFFDGNLIVPDELEEINLENQDSKKEKILVTGSVLTFDENSIRNYKEIEEIIDKNKYEIYTPLDTMSFNGSNEERYARAMELLRNTKLIIAEMSNVSTGQGMELQEAVNLNIPIIVVAKEGSKVSGLVKGCPGVIEIIYYNEISNIKEKNIKIFIGEII